MPRSGAKFCTRCGLPYPQSGAALREGQPTQSRPAAGPSWQGPQARHGGPWSEWAVVAVVVAAVVVLGGGGTGAWLYLHRGAPAPDAGRQVGNVGPITPTSTSPPPTSPEPTSPSPSSPTPTSPTPTSPSPSSPSPGEVAIAAGVSDPAAPQVATFLGQYFDAINAHDYAAYYGLESPQQQQGLTSTQFENGYGSTADSGETLQDVSVDANGDYVAQVTFTSTQDSAQSATGTGCTKWDISLYLIPNGTSYLIDAPPSSYHAAYAAC